MSCEPRAHSPKAARSSQLIARSLSTCSLKKLCSIFKTISIFALMSLPKSEHKTALLLSPHRLHTDHIILESLHITKSSGGMQFTTSDLDATELSAFYAVLPAQAKEVLRGFGKKGIGLANDEIRKRFDQQRAGLAFEPYYNTAITRRLYDRLEQL